MEVYEQSKGYQLETEEEDKVFCGSAEFDSNPATDDSDEDPIYEILEESHSKLSKLSIKKKPRPSMVDVVDMGRGLFITNLMRLKKKKKALRKLGE